MSPFWALLSLIFVAATHSYRLDYDQIDRTDSLPFQRFSVESTHNSTKSHEEFKVAASSRVPLRDAVEAYPSFSNSETMQSLQLNEVPNYRESNKRLPLRDAVERRVPPTFDGFDHKSIWLEQVYPPVLRSVQNVPYAICHFEASAAYRSEPFSLPPQIIPSRKCTHVVYNAATLDPHELTVISRDTEYDKIKGGYKSVIGLRQKNPSLRVLISIVSPDQGRLYKELVNSAECCAKFVTSVLKFLEEEDFDGVQLEWERSNSELKFLLQQLYEPLKERGYVLVASLKSDEVVDTETLEMMDFLILRAWSHHDNYYAANPAPLKVVQKTIKRWLNSGLDSKKIVLDSPLFGKSYTLKYKNATKSGSEITGPGYPGPYTLHRGYMAYYEICEKMEDQWEFDRDDNGPYIKFGDQWIGFDDPISIKLKMAYIRSVGLGGVSLKSLDLDDFQGICGDTWPMLNAATETLGIYDIPIEKCWRDGLFFDSDTCSGFLICDKGNLYRGNCGYGRFYDRNLERCVKAQPDVCYPGHSDSYNSLDTEINLSHLREKQQLEKLIVKENNARVICYMTSWALYRKGEGKFVPEHLDSRLCTDVVYAFAGLNPDTLLMQPFDPWADIENNLYQRVTSTKGSRVLLALGGWTDSSGDKYSRLVSSAVARRKFVAAAVNFLKKHNFQGLSLEWNYPKCWQSDCKKGPESDKPNFTKLLKELRQEFDRQEPKMTLAVVLSGYKEIIDRAYEVRDVVETVDFASVMTYDYHGAWEPRTGHLSPLYAMSGDTNPYYNVNFTMEYLVSLGAERSKLIVGIPMYGQAYKLSLASHTNLGDAAAGPGTPGEFTRQPGMLSYYEICNRVKKMGWISKPGYAYNKDQWVGYDNVKSVMEKGEYILNHGFGGALAWTVDLDDFTNRCCMESFPLLRSLNRALGRLLTSAPAVENCQKPEEPVTPEPPTMTTHSDANDGVPRPTKPMSTRPSTKPTTWPTWTEKPTKWTTWSTTPSTTWSTTPSTTWSWSTTTKTTTRKPVTTTRPFTTTTRAPTDSTLRPGQACNTGMQHIPDPSNCGNYFRCVLGELRREHCAPGLHWDARRSVCDWPSAAKCQSGSGTTQRPKPTTTKPPTTTQPSWVQTSMKPVEKPKQECEHGHYYEYPESCTNFLICVNGNLVKHSCAPGLNWNAKKNMCDWAFKNPCNQKFSHKTTYATEQSEECTSGSFVEVPGDCGSYQACLWGRLQLFQCAPGLHFNKQSGICDWPIRAKCKSAGPSSTSRPTIKPTSSLPNKPLSTSTKRPTTTTESWQWTEPTKPLPPPEIDPNKVSPLSGYFKVVCYFTNWAWYRRGLGKYLPENIDHTLCTHIVYGFAVLDYSDLTIKAHDSWADYDNRFYDRVVAYKNRGLKVTIALGGWNDSAGDKYSRLVNNPAARRRFVDHVIKFIEKHGFDGLDLDWEYPVCWQVECNKGPASDKEGFAMLLKELSDEFKPRNLLLSAAVSPSKQVIDKGYDVPALAKYLDWIAVMTYDYHGQWDKKTGHVAPLYYHPQDDYYYFNANYSINYWISKGAPPRNIVMGMPLYGQAFSINDPSAGTGLNAPASAGHAGEFTKAAGFLAYYEICDRINNRGWTVVQDPERRMGPYAYKGNQWVGFDDSDMIRQKAQFIRDMGLGGGMVWALDLDDFKGKCNLGPHPLMHTLQQVLAEPPTYHDRPIKTPFFGQELDWIPPNDHHTQVSTELIPPSSVGDHGLKQDDDEYKVVCYFTNWAWYRQGGGRFLPEDIDADLCTHILYGFAVLDTSNYVIKSHDPWADVDNKFYERVVAYKKKGKKVLVAIGGWNDSAGDKYSKLVNSAPNRKRFITNVIQFIEKWDFDGLDLDWEYPVCWQVDCSKGPKSDKEAFANFVRELSAEFKPRGLLLSAAVSPSKMVIDEGYDVPTLSKYLDWIAVMTYDFHGQWDKKTGHVAPLYARPDDWAPTFNANFSMNYWIQKGASPKKLVMGAPLYGQSFSLAERNIHGLNSPTYGGGEAGEDTRARGFLAYYEICERTLKKGWTVVQDPERRIGPYAYKGDQWVSFDDAQQIKLKAQLIKDLGLAGGMVWALDLDDFKNRCGCEPSPLLRTMNRVLRNYPDGPLCTVTNSPTTEVTESPQMTPAKPDSSRPTRPPTPSTDNDVEVVEAGPSPPSLPPIGQCDEKIFLPHKQDCSKYLLCNFGQYSEQSCPNGLFWNENRCDWPENTKCKINQEEVHVHNVFYRDIDYLF